MICELCKLPVDKLVNDRVCYECYLEAPDWVKKLVIDRKISKSRIDSEG